MSRSPIPRCIAGHGDANAGAARPVSGFAVADVLLAARERRAHLTNLPDARAHRCAASAALGPDRPPNTRHARRRAANTEHRIQLSPARTPRQSLAFGSLGGTSLAVPPVLVNVGVPCAAAVAPAALSHRPLVLRDHWRRAHSLSGPTGSPHAPPSSMRGTCGGIFDRWARQSAHRLRC